MVFSKDRVASPGKLRSSMVNKSRSSNMTDTPVSPFKIEPASTASNTMAVEDVLSEIASSVTSTFEVAQESEIPVVNKSPQ